MDDTEKVDHPQHYGGDTTYEAIKVIEAWDVGSLSPTSGFNLGNALKYIARLGKKSGEDLSTTLAKIVWYCQREHDNEKARERDEELRQNDQLDSWRLALNTALNNKAEEWGNWAKPLVQDAEDPEGGVDGAFMDAAQGLEPVANIPGAAEDAPRAYETPSPDPIVRTTYYFNRESGHNEPAYVHQSGRISLDGDPSV